MGDLAVFRGREALLLDLDGTFYDNQDHQDYVAEVDRVTGLLVADHYRLSDPRAAYKRLLADQQQGGMASKTETIQAVCGLDLPAQNRHRERWTRPAAFLTKDVRLRRVLQLLAARFRLYLGTNNAPGLVREIFLALELQTSLFQGLYTSEELGAAKPDERFFLRFLERAALSPAAVVSVGDRLESDLYPARKLGMGAYLVRRIEDVYRLEAAWP